MQSLQSNWFFFFHSLILFTFTKPFHVLDYLLQYNWWNQFMSKYLHLCGNKTTMNNLSSLSFRLKMDNTSASQNLSDVQIVDFPHFTSIEDCQERCGISNTDWCESIISFTRYAEHFWMSHTTSHTFFIIVHQTLPPICPIFANLPEYANLI